MIVINKHIVLRDEELQFAFICSPGPGGQNVNKLATAVQLRFNVVQSSSLPHEVRERLLMLIGNKLTQHGEIIIKASRHRTQERNKQDAIERLTQLIKKAAIRPKKRKKTKPTLGSIQKRLQQKKRHGNKKSLRRGRLSHE